MFFQKIYQNLPKRFYTSVPWAQNKCIKTLIVKKLKTLMFLLSNSLASFRKYLVKFKNQVSLMSLKFGLSLYLINWMLARNKNFHYKMFVSCSELILLYRIFLIVHISSFIQWINFFFYYFIFYQRSAVWIERSYLGFTEGIGITKNNFFAFLGKLKLWSNSIHTWYGFQHPRHKL